MDLERNESGTRMQKGRKMTGAGADRERRGIEEGEGDKLLRESTSLK
jgi:hypothetical protein